MGLTLQTNGPSQKAIELNYEAVREGWSVYNVHDKMDVVLKAKLVLLKIFIESIDPSGNPTIGAGANLLFTVSVPEELRGPKIEQRYTREELAASIVADDIPFDTVKEDWNEYKSIEGIVIGIKPVVTTVSRTSKYDRNGDPIYFVKHQTVHKGKFPPNVLENLRKILAKKES
jgi:hypothetical protein